MDNVVIEGNDEVEIDIETAKIHWLTINTGARVVFSRTKNATLNCHSVKVWGSLELGTELAPIPRGVTATIKLFGDAFAQTVIMEEGHFLVNKVIAVLGNLTAYGTPLENWEHVTFTKLNRTADAGSTALVVKGNVSSWKVG